MNLAAMAQLITTELGVYDDTSVLLAKVFLSKNYVRIWNKYPWGDANGYGFAQAEAGTVAVDYPTGMDRIITVRAQVGGSVSAPSETPDPPDDPTVVPSAQFDAWFLDPVDSTFLIESEPRMFETHGPVKYYEEIGFFDPGDTQRQIRLYPIPIRGTTLFFYGKMQCPGLGADTDEPKIRNIDVALIDYATSDMLRRQRQYDKADRRYKVALENETDAWNLEQQQANKPRRTKATTVAGNSLSEMTDAVCQICGQWTPEYRQIIHEFLRRNYQALYDVYLWPESLVMVNVPYTTEQVILPEYIDRVIGIRGSNNMRMFPADAGLILDIQPSMFDEMGDSISYTTLTPVGVSTLPNTTTKLVFASTNPADTGQVIVRGEILSTGTQLEEPLTLNGTNPVTTFFSYDIPLTVSKDVTLGFVTVNAASNGQLLVQLLPYQREQKHQRLWFLPAPQQSGFSTIGGDISVPPPAVTTYRALILAKRAIRPLLADADTPIITGAQQVLIAAAAADVFRKLEKPDQAAAFQQKAGASTDVLKAKNTDQAASAPRFVPQVEPRSYISELSCSW